MDSKLEVIYLWTDKTRYSKMSHAKQIQMWFEQP